MKAITLVALLILTSNYSYAGKAVGNGADSVSVGSGRSLLDLVEKDDLEYFNFRMGDFDEELGANFDRAFQYGYGAGCFIGDKTAELFIHIFQVGMNGSYSSSSWIDEAGYDANTFHELKWAFTTAPLEDINDEGAIRIVNPETKKQLAIQSNGLVVVSSQEFNQLDSTSKAALKMHESFLYVTKKLNPGLFDKDGTEPVRSLNRRFVKYLKDYGSPDYGVEDAYRGLGITFEMTVPYKRKKK